MFLKSSWWQMVSILVFWLSIIISLFLYSNPRKWHKPSSKLRRRAEQTPSPTNLTLLNSWDKNREKIICSIGEMSWDKKPMTWTIWRSRFITLRKTSKIRSRIGMVDSRTLMHLRHWEWPLLAAKSLHRRTGQVTGQLTRILVSRLCKSPPRIWKLPRV